MVFIVTIINGKNYIEYDQVIKIITEYEKTIRKLEKESENIQDSHMKLYNDTKDEIHRLKDENTTLKAENQRSSDSLKEIENSLLYAGRYSESLLEKNKELLWKLKEYEKSDPPKKFCGDCPCEDGLPFSDDELDVDALISELQDQHQQDCIRYNDMRTAFLKTVDELAMLRKQFGVGQ